MNDTFKWLKSFSGLGSQKMGEIGILSFIAVMGISLISALLISYLYGRFYKGRSTGSQIYRAFPLLGISITAIFITIQFSLPLSLGLLGALSIVRFRTPIKEPEEIGFIMLVVATSLCCATFNMIFLVIILMVALVGMVILDLKWRMFSGRLNDGMLMISVSASEFPSIKNKLLSLLKEKLPSGNMDAITEGESEIALSYNFVNMEQAVLIGLQEEIKKISGNAKANFYFNSSVPFQ
jgi:hypothetical protein